ncbi:MAG TPA: S-layer homology domain-containing protein [Chthonomonadaceae bacterium]|nr:S-layer homology domain-containing protein [Chthonomonadaceae bacterium]
MKTFLSCLVTALALLSLTRPAQAQVPFDAWQPQQDHWAYEAVTDLESKGILIGYPNGRFYGERGLTRYEFAVAMRRVLATFTHDMTVTVSNDRSDPMVPLFDDFFTGISSDPFGFTFFGDDSTEIGATDSLFPQFQTSDVFYSDWPVNLFGAVDLQNPQLCAREFTPL